MKELYFASRVQTRKQYKTEKRSVLIHPFDSDGSDCQQTINVTFS